MFSREASQTYRQIKMNAGIFSCSFERGDVKFVWLSIESWFEWQIDFSRSRNELQSSGPSCKDRLAGMLRAFGFENVYLVVLFFANFGDMFYGNENTADAKNVNTVYVDLSWFIRRRTFKTTLNWRAPHWVFYLYVPVQSYWKTRFWNRSNVK